MEFGKKVRITKEGLKEHPVGEDYLYTMLVHQIVDEMPTKYLKKLFNLAVIDSDDSKSTIKLMNKNLPEYERIQLTQLRDSKSIELKVSTTVNLK